jgi:basic amino acid/polyamine antiporter, APA family
MGLLTRKPLPELIAHHEEPDQPHLKRTLSTLDLIFFGIGVVIGAGLFSITGIAASDNAGPAVVFSFMLAAFGCALAGLCYAELATMIPVSGSAYTYSYASLGQLPAWLIGWSLILEYAIGAAAVSVSWSAYLISALHDLGIELPAAIIASPWQSVLDPKGQLIAGHINIPAVLIILAISILLIRGVKQSAIFNACMVVIKLATVLVFIAVGIFYIVPENYHPFIPENTGVFGEFGLSGILKAAGVVFFAYVGFDAISTTAQEVRNPQKSLPIGIMGSLLICTIIYILFAFVMTGLVNYKELNVAAPVALAISKTPYPWLSWIVKIAVLAGLTSVILVLLLGQSRIFYIMASDGLLPKLFETLHPKYATPWFGNIAMMLFVGLLAAFAPIDILGHMTSIGTLLAFVLVCIGVMILRYRHPEYPRPFKTPWFPWVPILGIAICTIMMVSLGYETWLRLIIWMLIGLIIYFAYGRRHAEV